MRILKFLNGFVTNSISLSITIELAIKKGQNIREYIQHNRYDDFDLLNDFLIEKDQKYLMVDYDRYNLYICTLTWGDENWEMDDRERSEVMKFIESIKLKSDGVNLIFLDWYEEL